MRKVAWNKNRKWPEVTKRRISEARKGIPAWNKGKEWSEEVRKKISQSRKGKAPWNKNRNWPKAVKDKIRRTKLATALGVLPQRPKSFRKGSKRLRFEIFDRDNYTCHYCGRSPSTFPNTILELDHVDPNGPTSPDNLVTACMDCNRGKSNAKLTQTNIKLPLTKKQKDIKHFISDFIYSKGYPPTQQEIADHFNIARSLVLYYLTILEKKGYIVTPGRKNRNISLKR